MSKKLIRKLVEVRGEMTTYALSKLIGVSVQRIDAMERAGQTVRSDMLYRYWRVWKAKRMGSAEEFLELCRPKDYKGP